MHEAGYGRAAGAKCKTEEEQCKLKQALMRRETSTAPGCELLARLVVPFVRQFLACGGGLLGGGGGGGGGGDGGGAGLPDCALLRPSVRSGVLSLDVDDRSIDCCRSFGRARAGQAEQRGRERERKGHVSFLPSSDLERNLT